MAKRHYIIMHLVKSHEVMIGAATRDLPLTWWDGMVGVAPIFSNKRKALKYVGKGNESQIVAVKIEG